MAWERRGTVAVTNGGVIVTGAGTQFNGNVQPGHAINLPDGRVYEVLSVDSQTQITLGSPYMGSSAGGQAYSVQPNQGFAQTAATRLADLLAQAAGWISGALAGRFGDGSPAAPGMTFAADQDTGARRYGENAFSLVTGGVDRLLLNPTGAELRGQWGVTGLSYVYNGQQMRFCNASNANWGTIQCVSTDASASLSITDGSGLGIRLDGSGNMLVGAQLARGGAHTVMKPVSQGASVLSVGASDANPSAVFAAVTSYAPNGSGAAIYVGRDSSTNRAINSTGTVNASGADYAEYMLKAAGCGLIAKGDVCGVDRDGKLTKTWADAVTFVIKSTDPSLVGGDTWDAHLPPKPENPGSEPGAPVAPTPPEPIGDAPAIPIRQDEEADDAFASRQADYVYARFLYEQRIEAMQAYDAAMAGHPAALAQWHAAREAWAQAAAVYAADLKEWEAAHEKARQCVDRIAFCGQVPANVLGDFEVGDYIIAAASGAGIKAVAVKADDMTLPQYMRRIGKVWAIRDGRAWIDVQHG